MYSFPSDVDIWYSLFFIASYVHAKDRKRGEREKIFERGRRIYTRIYTEDGREYWSTLKDEEKRRRRSFPEKD